MRRPTGWHLSILGFALACVLLAGVGWVDYRALTDLRDASRRVEHTLTVETEVADVLSLLTNAEVAQEGS
jgi:CHASE3 domain sensor protein